MTYVSPSRGRVRGLLAAFRRKAWHLAKRMIQPIRNPSGESRAGFVVGSGRSGTDLLAAKLGQSVDVVLINEDNPEGFHNWRLHGLDVIDALVSSSSAPLVLFKPIVETHRTMELLGAFEKSKAVFISRNYKDTVTSIVSFFGEKTRRTVRCWQEEDFAAIDTWSIPPEVRGRVSEMYEEDFSLADAAGIYWYVYNSAFCARGMADDPRVLLVLYEDLVTNPEEELRRACRHLTIQYRTSMTRDIFSSSANKGEAPELSVQVEAKCAALWNRIREARRRGHTGMDE